MKQSAKSLFFFGLYVVITGLVCLLSPDTLISMLQLPEVAKGWSSVIGLLVLVIGAYDVFAGRNGVEPMIKISVPVRLGFAAGTVLLVLLGQMPATLIVLGGADALGALWTAMALRAESKG